VTAASLDGVVASGTVAHNDLPPVELDGDDPAGQYPIGAERANE